MSPEAAAAVAKARQSLTKAHAMLAIGLADEAGRAAYLAGFQAAQALIFDRLHKVAKTHSGVRTLFGQLAAQEPLFDAELRTFLSRTYPHKNAADYELDPVAAVVTEEEARAAMLDAARLVDVVAALLGSLDDAAAP